MTLRYLSQLHHIGLGVEHRQLRVTMFIDNKDIRIVDADGVLIRALTLDPSRDHQPLGRPPGRQPRPTVVHDVVRHLSAMS
ncbi:MAG: hypothetical protein JOZ75_01300 [Candidatus Dormibacteraeota bacterium]|nr:hypothetical protein [Candidatus Dormibacteraeota bacterium]